MVGSDDGIVREKALNLYNQLTGGIDDGFTHETIDGIADFSMTPLTSLPERFTVGMCLDVSDTHIQEFPRNLKVGWKIQVGKNATQSMKARVAALERKTCQPARASGRKATT